MNVTVKTPVNFPVDLYYLMDLSLSMKDDKEQIEDLGDILGSYVPFQVILFQEILGVDLVCICLFCVAFHLTFCCLVATKSWSFKK